MRSRGFTLLELFIALAITAALAGLGAFTIDRTVKQMRTDRAARNLQLDLRFAESIATRTNRSVRLVFRRDPTDGCPGSSYVIEGTETVNGVNAFDTRYRMVCIGNVYPQVVVSAESAPGDFGDLTCVNDSGADAATPLAADGCTFCGGAATGTLTFQPSGEIFAAPVPSATGIEALSFSWRDDPEVANPSAPATQVRAVSINRLGGRTRVLRPVAATAGDLPTVWGCR